MISTEVDGVRPDGFDLYIRRARLLSTIDGDTVRLEVDCGFETFRHVRIRIDGIDTAEMRSDPVKAQHARDVTNQILSSALTIWVQTHRKETYQDEEMRTFERYVGTVMVGDLPIVDILKQQLTYDTETHKWGKSRGATGTPD